MHVAAPPRTRAMLLMSRQSAHGWSDTKPTTTRPTVLAMPMMEIRKAAWAAGMPRSMHRVGR